MSAAELSQSCLAAELAPTAGSRLPTAAVAGAATPPLPAGRRRRRTCMLRVANSTPMVDLLSSENSLRVNRLSRLDLPTPLSPISTTLNR